MAPGGPRARPVMHFFADYKKTDGRTNRRTDGHPGPMGTRNPLNSHLFEIACGRRSRPPGWLSRPSFAGGVKLDLDGLDSYSQVLAGGYSFMSSASSVSVSVRSGFFVRLELNDLVATTDPLQCKNILVRPVL